MEKYYSDGVLSLTAGGTVARGELVKLSSGKVVKTTAATDVAIGVALDGAASDELVPVKILGAGGVVQLKAAGAISAGGQITAEGKATAADTDKIVGIALEAASASGDYILFASQVAQVK